ncbi:GMC family oxidoreductase [Haloglycomyces albus]|uniref:GMC family oxidoreductase n=1 Tax=Haloglycomyces albus TaxID=526067 RepID=UPI00046C8C54|nr:GMC oxidoreductase [Haloglycomyces albus]
MAKDFNRRTFLGATGLTGLAAIDILGIGDPVDATDEAPEEVDFVVVGSGPGGTPVATRLAQEGFTVLVLEAGPPAGDDTLYSVPALHHKIGATDTEVRWDYYVRHYTDQELSESSSQWVEGRGVLYPRASTLGGCSAHHAMITMYPEPSDWTHIQRVTGDDSWHPERMWQHWERLRSWQPLEHYALNEFVSIDPQVGALVDATLNEVAELPGGGVTDDWEGLNVKENISSRNQGFYPPELATDHGRRVSMRERLRSTARQHPDRLYIVTDALAERIHLDGDSETTPRAVAVDYLKGRHLYAASPEHRPIDDGTRTSSRRTVKVHREVIVAAGAYNSPQLLMLSGIGPKSHLTGHGIECRVDLPGVGANLQDRYEVPVVTEHPDFMLLSACTFGEGLFDPCLSEWEAMQRTPLGELTFYGTNGAIGAVKRRYGDDERAQLYVFGLPVDFRGYRPGYDDGYVHDKFTWLILKGFDSSRQGTVRLRSADPTETPRINHRKFDDGDLSAPDIDALVDSLHMVRRINANAAVGTEVWPGESVETEAEIRRWIRQEAWGHHASCTNPIGSAPAEGAVLDGRFRVHGVTGLRVVDASSFPRIPGLFLWAPTAIISEKAGEDILTDHS